MQGKRYSYLLILSVLVLNLTSCFAQQTENNIRQRSWKHTNLKSLDVKIMKWQKELNIHHVAIGIIENNKLLKMHVYGNDHNGQPASINMLFDVASVTKVIFTTLVLKLVEQGKWNLDEPIYHYYIDPEVASNSFSKKLTTRHVLSHQSGFDNWRWMNSTGKLTFNFEPGTRFNYSGEGFEYLQKAIEGKFHKSLDTLSDSILFKPLCMYNTRHGWDGQKNFARYSRMFDSEGKEMVKTDYSIQASAAAGLTTTIADLTRFALEVLNGAHLSKALYRDMVKPQAVINPNLSQGLGWRIVNKLPDNEFALEHAGNDPGVASLIVLLPNSKRAVVVLTNGDNGLFMCNNIVRAAFADGALIIFKAYKSGPADEQHPVFTLGHHDLKKYIGNYKRADGVDVRVTLKNNGLVLRMSGVPVLNLIPQSESRFYLLDLDTKIVFTKDVNGQIDSLSIQDGENKMSCKKVIK